MTTWSKTPPSEPGWYWCRYPSAVRVWQEPFAYLHMAGSSASDPRAEYGPRISPEAIEAAKDALREAADEWERLRWAFSNGDSRRDMAVKMQGQARAALAKLDPDGPGEGAAT